MGLPRIFKMSESAPPEVLALLQRTQLGTNGAQYKHLDTRKRLSQLVSPLFLYVQRDKKVLGNITFCRRIITPEQNAFYIRYFAFDTNWSASNSTQGSTGDSILKRGLQEFFSCVFNGDYGDKPSLIYAYIEPNNTRSLWMAKSFNFRTVTTLNTFVFSRFRPKQSEYVRLLNESELDTYKVMLLSTYKNHSLFFNYHTLKDQPIYGFFENGELVAACKAHEVNWEIKRLPGKYGKILTELLPYIPGLNKLINPKSHRFVAIEGMVSVSKHNIWDTFFSAILAAMDCNLLLSWHDEKDIVLHHQLSAVRRGLAKQLISSQSVQLVVKERPGFHVDVSHPFYVSAFDLI